MPQDIKNFAEGLRKAAVVRSAPKARSPRKIKEAVEYALPAQVARLGTGTAITLRLPTDRPARWSAAVILGR